MSKCQFSLLLITCGGLSLRTASLSFKGPIFASEKGGARFSSIREAEVTRREMRAIWFSFSSSPKMGGGAKKQKAKFEQKKSFRWQNRTFSGDLSLFHHISFDFCTVLCISANYLLFLRLAGSEAKMCRLTGGSQFLTWPMPQPFMSFIQFFSPFSRTFSSLIIYRQRFLFHWHFFICDEGIDIDSKIEKHINQFDIETSHTFEKVYDGSHTKINQNFDC